MSKLSKRKTIVTVGKRIPTAYEIQKDNRLKAIEVANSTPDEIKNKKIRYLLK
jgi:hypothetical protein